MFQGRNAHASWSSSTSWTIPTLSITKINNKVSLKQLLRSGTMLNPCSVSMTWQKSCWGFSTREKRNVLGLWRRAIKGIKMNAVFVAITSHTTKIYIIKNYKKTKIRKRKKWLLSAMLILKFRSIGCPLFHCWRLACPFGSLDG